MLLSCVFCLCTRPLLFSLRRGLCLKQVLSRASFYCRRLVLVDLLFLSSLCSPFFSSSFSFCCLRFWDLLSIGQTPSPVVRAAVARSFGLNFDLFCLSFLHSLLVARNYILTGHAIALFSLTRLGRLRLYWMPSNMFSNSNSAAAQFR